MLSVMSGKIAARRFWQKLWPANAEGEAVVYIGQVIEDCQVDAEDADLRTSKGQDGDNPVHVAVTRPAELENTNWQ